MAFWLSCKVVACISVIVVLKFTICLGTGKSYGPTAQHLWDCLIILVELNFVHKLKQNKVLPPYVKLPATRWHLGFHFLFLFLNLAILHSYIFWKWVIKSAKTCLYSLPSINYFCWIDLVCLYRCEFRHIVGFYPPFLYFFSLMACIVIFIFMSFPEHPMGISSMGSFRVWSGGSQITCPAL